MQFIWGDFTDDSYEAILSKCFLLVVSWVCSWDQLFVGNAAQWCLKAASCDSNLQLFE